MSYTHIFIILAMGYASFCTITASHLSIKQSFEEHYTPVIAKIIKIKSTINPEYQLFYASYPFDLHPLALYGIENTENYYKWLNLKQKMSDLYTSTQSTLMQSSSAREYVDRLSQWFCETSSIHDSAKGKSYFPYITSLIQQNYVRLSELYKIRWICGINYDFSYFSQGTFYHDAFVLIHNAVEKASTTSEIFNLFQLWKKSISDINEFFNSTPPEMIEETCACLCLKQLVRIKSEQFTKI